MIYFLILSEYSCAWFCTLSCVFFTGIIWTNKFQPYKTWIASFLSVNFPPSDLLIILKCFPYMNNLEVLPSPPSGGWERGGERSPRWLMAWLLLCVLYHFGLSWLPRHRWGHQGELSNLPWAEFVRWRLKASQVALVVKNPPASAGDVRDAGLIPELGKIPGRRAWQPTPVFSPGESPWKEEPGRLQFMGSQRAGHDWATKHSTVAGGDFVVAGELSNCCMWDLVPWPGIEPRPHALGCKILATGPPGKSLPWFLKVKPLSHTHTHCRVILFLW